MKKKKIIDYDNYVAKNRLKFMAKLSELWVGWPGRIGRMRPRNPVESRMLTKLDELRRNRMLKSGELRMLGPRTWRLKIT